MKKIFKILAYTLGAVLVLGVCTASFVYIKGVPKYAFAPTPEIANLKVIPDSTRVERGKKIASLLCNECHSDEERNLTGKVMPDMPKEFGTVASYNITQDKVHGIGEWTDGEIYYFLRTGIRKNGSWAPPYMPKFPLMADEDIYSVIAWLHSDDPRLQPNEREFAPNRPNMLMKVLCNTAFLPPPLPAGQLHIPDSSDTLAFGRYIANGLCACFGCHSADLKTINYLTPEKSTGFYGGGNPLLNREGEPVPSANITFDHETGIGNLTREQFLEAVRFGKNPRGGALKYPMFPHTALSDTEVNAIYSYLQTVPPIKNKVQR